ncbi:MAG: hypothetical protein NE330_10770 [Lentisphaeraceae bacterium]|nr:hypothetical protein [Lentisphaeraceae bacterium]
MKYIIINLLLILSASGMDLVTLKEIVAKSPSKEMRNELKVFSEAGEYEIKLKFTIHAQNKTMDLPPALISTKIVDEKYLVSEMPISDTQVFLEVITYDKKDKAYKRYSANPEGVITTFIGLTKGNIITWTSIDKADGSQDLIIEIHEKDKGSLHSVTYKDGKLSYTMTGTFKKK